MTAYYEQLPVYRQSLDLTVWTEEAVRSFPRYHKYTIGSELRNTSREITLLVAAANTKKDRKEILLRARNKIEELKLLFRVCMELKIFRSFRSYEHAIRQIAGIARQTEGWLNRSS